MLNNFHYYHIVENSPWPLIASNNALLLVLSILLIINSNSISATATVTIAILATSFCWWNNVSSEAIQQGLHPSLVSNGLQIGIILFIASEVLFFSSFFWAFFHSSISPTIEIAATWPPNGITPFNPINIPLLNTIILLSSGVTVTWCHHSILNNNINDSNTSLATTILLGGLFSALQGFEYNEATFSISDSTFGSTFFIATGFHGLHVIIGSTFLTTALYRISQIKISNQHLTGFECAAWYWHFVDVVWLFLYSSIYWWGSCFNKFNNSTTNFQLGSNSNN